MTVGLAPAPTWTQTARSNDMYAGSLAGTVGNPIVLTPGMHLGQFVVLTATGQAIPCDTATIQEN